ncbi:alcohol acetyltransferase [Xylogone sp. PMI_703]|nr:alcohol acetyltransferase [Xylogone sp. PMI_703]
MWFFSSKASHGENYLRAASPNERRCIARESLGFYTVLMVGGIYHFSEPADTSSISTYAYALRQCVERHPQLSSIIADTESNSPYYEFCPRLDLRNHIQLLEKSDHGNEVETIEAILPGVLDASWPSTIPDWRIVVLPFSHQRSFIGFCCSHALGDGMSGIAFHKTFLAALQERRVENDLVCTPTLKQLTPPFDTPKNLPISWSFLLSPLLGAYLPKWLASWLGFKASTSAVTSGTWTGPRVFYHRELFRTGIQILTIDASSIDKALKICRMHNAKLTALFHQLINTALLESLPQSTNIDNLVAQTAMNMRDAAGIPKYQMGNFSSIVSQNYPTSNINKKIDWVLARSVTEELAARAKTLQDQPVGLLRYLTDVRAWVLSRLGSGRDCSYAVSNLLSFQSSTPLKRCSITEMFFSQPADVISGPLTFNVVSVGGGPMSIAVSWQMGALSVGSNEDEIAFVKTVCQKIERGFAQLASDNS